MHRESTVNGIFVVIIPTKTLTTLTQELIVWGMLILISCLSVSTSFVYTDIISPWAFVSKYLIGSLSIWTNKSSLSRFSVPCPTFTIIRL